MKAISIKQPWASLICAGFKVVEDYTNTKTNLRGKILIHSFGSKCPKDFLANTLPLSISTALINEENYGNINLYSECFPANAIVGYIDVKTSVDGKYGSNKADGESVELVHTDAYLFDEPITGVKCKCKLFDYDLDENNLPPARKVARRAPRIEGNELVVPFASWLFDRINDREGERCIFLFVTEDTNDLFYNYGMEEDKFNIMDFYQFCEIAKERDEENRFFCLKNFSNIKTLRAITNDGREKTFKLKDIIMYKNIDDNDEPFIFAEYLGDEAKKAWLFCITIE